MGTSRWNYFYEMEQLFEERVRMRSDQLFFQNKETEKYQINSYYLSFLGSFWIANVEGRRKSSF